MTEKPEIQGMSIVLLGDFNPKIFQPAWFAAENLIRSSEAEAVNIEIINPEIAIFNLDWLQVQITRDRCAISTAQEPYYEIVRDLCLGTFKLLKHTPIRVMGINWRAHFRMRSIEDWHNLGHKLAPKDLWNTILKEPGMQSLKIQGTREDGYKGHLRITTEPSVKVSPGVYIQVNDHYQADDPIIGSDKIINILEASYNQSKRKADEIIHAVLNWS